MNREQFLGRLRESRLLTPEELRRAADCPDGDGSAAGVAEALTAEGLLTRFQARALLEGGERSLVLGQYRLLDELGAGGMGQVFKACHAVMGRVVALKVLRPLPEDEAVAQGWFDREVRTLTQLQHPNIVLAYDANEVDGVRFLVMEYVEGQNLEDLVRDRGPLPVALACDMMAEAAAALQYAHEKGLVHRDLKPANLLIPSDALAAATTADQPQRAWGGEPRPRGPLVKIVDFGLARLHAPAAAGTIVLRSPEHFAGTPDYVSPEQCQDVHNVDIRSDLYSLGCTFFFALTGRPPFRGPSVLEKLANHLMEPPTPVTKLRPDAPTEVAEVILKLMAKEPDDRFQTPAALVRALRPLCLAYRMGPRFRAWPALAVPDALARLHAEAPGTAVVAAGAAARVGTAQSAVRRLEEPSLDGARDAAPAIAAESPELAHAAGQEAGEASGTGAEPRPASENGREQAEGNGDGRDDAPVDPLLRDGWRQWTDLVAALGNGRGRNGWDDRRYIQLRESLLTACRRGAADGPPARRAWFRRLEETVAPWISLESLERTEPELLRSLLAQCVQVEKRLGVRRPPQWLAGWLRTCAAAVLILWLVFQAGAAGWRLLSAQAGGMSGLSLQSVLHSLQLDSFGGQICMLLPLIALLAVLLVRK